MGRGPNARSSKRRGLPIQKRKVSIGAIGSVLLRHTIGKSFPKGKSTIKILNKISPKIIKFEIGIFES